MSDYIRIANEVEVCPACESEEIDVVNAFSEKITVECRHCGNVDVIYDSGKVED